MLRAMPYALSVGHLRKSYRTRVAVDDVSFDVERNEIFGIIGPNGSGKTTTVECLQGLRMPDGGDVEVLGLDPRTQGAALRRRIGSQLQESALPDRVKVWEALDLFAAASTQVRDWREVARKWGVYERRNNAFASLSGGERQRLFVALALISDPEIVFLDEMTTGLDPAARRVAWSLIEAARGQGATIVLVTHFMDEVEQLCDRVAVFVAGRVRAIDAPANLTRLHGDARTVRFSTDAPDVSWLTGVPGVTGVEHDGTQVTVRGAGGVLAHVGAALVAHELAPPDLRVEIPTLEDAYLNLVKETGS
jgi:ABC-2 type transport system ATP-binding protein